MLEFLAAALVIVVLALLLLVFISCFLLWRCCYKKRCGKDGESQLLLPPKPQVSQIVTVLGNDNYSYLSFLLLKFAISFKGAGPKTSSTNSNNGKCGGCCWGGGACDTFACLALFILLP